MPASIDEDATVVEARLVVYHPRETSALYGACITAELKELKEGLEPTDAALICVACGEMRVAEGWIGRGGDVTKPRATLPKILGASEKEEGRISVGLQRNYYY